MDDLELILHVKAAAGLRSLREARRATAAALGALRCALEEEDARALSKALPRKLAHLLERPQTTVVQSIEGLYADAERRERVGLGFAMEHVQVVLQVLLRQLDPELVTRLRKRLSPDVAELLEEHVQSAEPPPHVRIHPGHLPTRIQTLSRARPGTAEPIADTHHELAHEGSVVRSDAPHADRMVETARSTRPNREDETLARGAPRSSRR
jgi:uncharacterized protein (DUF2267 family)